MWTDIPIPISIPQYGIGIVTYLALKLGRPVKPDEIDDRWDRWRWMVKTGENGDSDRWRYTGDCLSSLHP